MINREEAKTYNRRMSATLWANGDALPNRWPGKKLWPDDEDGFVDAVAAFQAERSKYLAWDGKLGKLTLAALKEQFPDLPDPLLPSDLIRNVGGAGFRRSLFPLSPPSKIIAAKSKIAQTWNNYGGEIARQAQFYGLSVAPVLAVFAVEAGGQSHDPSTGLVIIRVEIPHRFPGGEADFRSRYGKGQTAEWTALSLWAATEPQKAFEKTSWGLAQIMGFNAQLIGYETAMDMAIYFQNDCRNQIAGFFKYIAARHLIDAINDEDWRTFAGKYNGPSQVETYASAIETALAQARMLDIE